MIGFIRTTNPSARTTQPFRGLCSAAHNVATALSRPQGYGSVFDELTLDVTAANGLFGGAQPTAVEISHVGLGSVRTEPAKTIDMSSGLVSPGARPAGPSAEKKVEPPDTSGIGLFTELHSELGATRRALSHALESVHPGATFDQAVVTDRIWRVLSRPGIEHHSTRVEFKPGAARGVIRVAAELRVEQGQPQNWEYPLGVLEAWQQDPQSLGKPSLVALSGLHGALNPLYWAGPK
jgi:hypothetical protein